MERAGYTFRQFSASRHVGSRPPFVVPEQIVLPALYLTSQICPLALIEVILLVQFALALIFAIHLGDRGGRISIHDSLGAVPNRRVQDGASASSVLAGLSPNVRDLVLEIISHDRVSASIPNPYSKTANFYEDVSGGRIFCRR